MVPHHNSKLVRSSLLLCLVLSSLGGFGQSNHATLAGSITDPEHSAIPNASVQLTSVATRAVRQVSSGTQGNFEISGLQPGDYELQVQAPGFATLKENLRLEVGQQMTLNVSLKVGSVSQAVNVEARVETLRTADSSVGVVVEPVSIRELPLNGRMLIDLVLTVPGAHMGHGAQTGETNPLYWRPGQRSAVTIGGARPNANYFLLDGTTNTDPTFNTLNLSPSPDAVQEFKVQVGSYSAEMGSAGGGQINIVTRSGTNHLRGTVYEFLRNGALDAHAFEQRGSNHLVQNNFGASLGGPIARDKTFFFLNFEGLRHTQAITMIDTVPTALEAVGDFSRSGRTIYNPFSAHPNPAYNPSLPVSPSNPQIIRDPFSGNVIPPGLLNPAALLFFRQYVVRPDLGSGAGVDSNNYLDVRNERHVTNQGTARLDHVFANGDTLTGRYSASSETGFTPQNLPAFGAFHDNLAQNASVSWNHIFGAHMVNMAAFTFSRLSMHRFSENNESNDIISQLGIVGVGFGGQGAFGAPFFNVQGYTGMGDSFAATPVQAWDTVLEGRDLLSWQKGRHSLKFGGSYRRYLWPMWGFFQNRGYYQFTNGFTTQTATNDGTGSALASFLLGLPAVKQRQAGIPRMDLRQWYLDAFVQDTWQFTRTTTLNVGLRYEYMSPLRDLTYTNTNLTFQNGQPFVFVGGQLGTPRA
jgi:outer membrane receptor protein involved in Fe transport